MSETVVNSLPREEPKTPVVPSLPMVAPLSMTSQFQTPRLCTANIPSVDIGDLIAYEFFDTTCDRWRCELARVLDRIEEDSLLVERLAQMARKSIHGVVATTEEGKNILQQLGRLQEELTQRIRDANKRSQEVREKRRAVEKEWKEAVEAVEQAQEQLGDVRTAVEHIDAANWRELMSYRTPPEIVVRVMSAVVLVLGERRRTWAEILPTLHRPGMLQLLANFDSSELTAAQREEVLQRYINTPKFTYEEAIKGSHALSELYRWVIAHVLMMNASEHQKYVKTLRRDHNSDLNKKEKKLQEDSKKITTVSSDIEALWKRFNDVEQNHDSTLQESTGTTPQTPRSARRRRTRTESCSPSSFGETLQLMSRPWYYTSDPERRIISVYSVICSFGRSPHRNETIKLNEEQCNELLAATQERDRLIVSCMKSANFLSSGTVNNPDNNGASATKTPEHLTPRAKRKVIITQLQQHLNQHMKDKMELEQQQQQKNSSRKKKPSETPLKKTIQRAAKLRAAHKKSTTTNDVSRQLKELQESTSTEYRQSEDHTPKSNNIHRQTQDSTPTFIPLDLYSPQQEATTAELEKRLQEQDAGNDALSRQSSEKDDAMARLEQRLQERDAAMAELERMLKEQDASKDALSRQSSEKDDAMARLEQRLQERDAAMAELERMLKEQDASTDALSRQRGDVHEVYCSDCGGRILSTDNVTMRETKRGLTVGTESEVLREQDDSMNGVCILDLLRREHKELSEIEEELHEAEGSVKEQKKVVKDEQTFNRLRRLVSMYTRETVNGNDSLDIKRELHSLLHEHERRVQATNKALMEEDAKVVLLRTKLDSVVNCLDQAAKLLGEKGRREEQNEEGPLLEELQSKYCKLSEALSDWGSDLNDLHKLQSAQHERMVRTLWQCSPVLAKKYAKNGFFFSESLETGVFSLLGSVMVAVACGSLLYKRYALI